MVTRAIHMTTIGIAALGLALQAAHATSPTPAAAPTAAPAAAAPTAATPAPQLKPWTPKQITKAQVRPQLKPPAPAAAANIAPQPVEAAANKPVMVAANAPAPVATPMSLEPSAQAATSPAATLADFKGRYLGSGAEVALTPTTDEPPRRLSQVEISGDENEFTVRWATARLGANFKAETVKATQQILTFRPSGQPNRYVAVADEQGKTAPNATAEIKGRTMLVTKIDTLPSGVQSIQVYERTLTDAGMTVRFVRKENDKFVKQVNLTLTKSQTGFW